MWRFLGVLVLLAVPTWLLIRSFAPPAKAPSPFALLKAPNIVHLRRYAGYAFMGSGFEPTWYDQYAVLGASEPLRQSLERRLQDQGWTVRPWTPGNSILRLRTWQFRDGKAHALIFSEGGQPLTRPPLPLGTVATIQTIAPRTPDLAEAVRGWWWRTVYHPRVVIRRR